jgi:hypothetical protein
MGSTDRVIFREPVGNGAQNAEAKIIAPVRKDERVHPAHHAVLRYVLGLLYQDRRFSARVLAINFP